MTFTIEMPIGMTSSFSNGDGMFYLYNKKENSIVGFKVGYSSFCEFDLQAVLEERWHPGGNGTNYWVINFQNKIWHIPFGTKMSYTARSGSDVYAPTEELAKQIVEIRKAKNNHGTDNTA